MILLTDRTYARWADLLYHCGGLATHHMSDASMRKLVEGLIDHPEPWRRKGGVETLLDTAKEVDLTLYHKLAWKAVPTAIRRSIDSFENDVSLAVETLDALLRQHGQATWQLDQTGMSPIHYLVQTLAQASTPNSTDEQRFLVARAERILRVMVGAGVDLDTHLAAGPQHPGRYQFADALDLACWFEEQLGTGGPAIMALLNIGADERLVLRLDTTGPRARQRMSKHPKLRAQALLAIAKEATP